MHADRGAARPAGEVSTPGGREATGEGGRNERAQERHRIGERDAAARAGAAALAPFLGSTRDPGTPPAQGLYDPALDKDSCGVGFIADIKGRKSHLIVEDGLRILCNLEHRGATGADPRMGDGAGILVQIPHKFFAKEATRLGFSLPAPGEYAVGYLFMPKRRELARRSFATSTPR